MDYKDPIKVSPDNYRLLLEDGNFRMVEMSLPAGRHQRHRAFAPR